MPEMRAVSRCPSLAAQNCKPEALQFEQIPSLQVRLGRAYVATHDYHQAVQFYEDSLRANPYDVDLRLDLAKLLCRLRRFPSAICVLKDCPIDKILDKTKQVQVLTELADVYQQDDPQQVRTPVAEHLRHEQLLNELARVLLGTGTRAAEGCDSAAKGDRCPAAQQRWLRRRRRRLTSAKCFGDALRVSYSRCCVRPRERRQACWLRFIDAKETRLWPLAWSRRPRRRTRRDSRTKPVQPHEYTAHGAVS